MEKYKKIKVNIKTVNYYHAVIYKLKILIKISDDFSIASFISYYDIHPKTITFLIGANVIKKKSGKVGYYWNKKYSIIDKHFVCRLIKAINIKY